MHAHEFETLTSLFSNARHMLDICALFGTLFQVSQPRCGCNLPRRWGSFSSAYAKTVGVFGSIRDQLYALFQSPPRLRPILRVERECRIALSCCEVGKREDNCTTSDCLNESNIPCFYFCYVFSKTGPTLVEASRAAQAGAYSRTFEPRSELSDDYKSLCHEYKCAPQRHRHLSDSNPSTSTKHALRCQPIRN